MSSAKDIFSMLATSRGPTVKALQSLLVQIGAATSGTKDVLQTRLLTEVARSKVPDPFKERESSTILSIDMGIRNLAYCVAQVRNSTPKAGAANMEILKWRRLDLTEEVFKHTLNRKKDLVEEAMIDGREEEDPFTPASLSSTAYFLLTSELLTIRPDVVLIERQRWRSSGGSAIQQWTVRVNTLEAILWAVLTTLRFESMHQYREDPRHKKQWRVFGVDPKRVSSYWLDDDMRTVSARQSKREDDGDVLDESELQSGNHAPTLKRLSRGKVEKKAKIQLLRSWLDSGNLSTAGPGRNKSNEESSVHRPFISFRRIRCPSAEGFLGDAETTRQSLLYATDTAAEKAKRTQIRKADVKKVDDLTDCFLQAAAWVAWEENRMQLQEHRETLRTELEEKLGRDLIGAWGPNSVEEAVREIQNGGNAEQQKEPAKKKKTPKTSKTKRGTKV